MDYPLHTLSNYVFLNNNCEIGAYNRTYNYIFVEFLVGYDNRTSYKSNNTSYKNMKQFVFSICYLTQLYCTVYNNPNYHKF